MTPGAKSDKPGRSPSRRRGSSASATPARARLLAALNWESHRSSALLGMLNRAVANQVKLNSTDIETLGVLNVVGSVTPTRLASLLAMGTGSMTLVIDRLERAGFVRRVRDVKDRRSVTIEIVEQPDRDLAVFYAPLQKRAAEIAERYSDSELAVIVDYLTRSNDMLNEIATSLGERSTAQAQQDT